MIKRLLLSALLLLAYSYASAQPANDSCVNAIALTVGTGVCNSVQYDNTGASIELTDPIPSCWVPASVSHTVWFTFTPDSSRVHISTNFNYSLANTQIAVYSGTCGAFTEIACQEDIYAFNGYFHTDMVVSGLTIGNTYYIMIDGNGNNTGTYGVCVENLGPPPPPIPSEDCITANYLCDNSTISVPNNTHGHGSVTANDHPYCFFPATDDPGAYWFQFTPITSGNLCFSIIPNDGVTNYNWFLADVTNGCAPLQRFDIDCNNDNQTGVITGIGCADPFACTPACVGIASGATYAILVSRITNNSTGFTLDFTTTTALFGGVPTPHFNHSDSVCVGQALTFTNTTTTLNQNLSFVWNFGDNNTSIQPSPTHTYSAPGTYTVTLIATCGSTSNVQTSIVHILPPLSASVTPSAATICNGDSVTLIGSATFNSSLMVPQAFTNSTPTSIPSFTTGTQSNLTIAGIGSTFFANPFVSVTINITHPEVGDLNVYLVAPDASQMALSLSGTFPGGANFTGTSFVPSGGGSLATGSAPYTGNWAPFDPFLPAFNFTPNNGVWTLLIDNFGFSSGTITSWSITYNIPNYLTYSWTPSTGLSTAANDTTVATPTVTTNYTFVATDATGCPGSASSLVSVTNTPQSSFTLNSTALCQDEVATVTYTGVASSNAVYTWNFGAATVISGSGAGPFLISWSGATTDSVTLVVQDSSCTSLTTTTYVTVNPTPTASTTGSDTLVCEGTSIDLFGTSTPSAGASFSWTGPLSFNSTSQNPVIPGATSSMTGLYFVNSIVNGCPSNPGANVFVQVIPVPVANATSNSPVCDEGTITLMTPATLGGTYSWTGPGSFSSTANNPTITPAGPSNAGTYTVTVSAGGCTSTPSNVTIAITPLPAAPVAGSNSPICETSSLDLFTDTIAGVSYAWTGPNGFSDPNQNTTRFPVSTSDAGDYLVVRTDSATGCTSHADTVNVQIDQKILATLSDPVMHTCTLNTQIIANDPSPGVGTWSLISGTGTPTPPNSFATTAVGVDTGTSVFQWLIVNNTCRDSIQLTVIHDGIDTCGTLEVNELITPNNDNLNERLIFTGLFSYSNNKLVIFNRWGSEVFSQNNYKNDWSGRTEAGTSGDELPDGTYYYILTVPGQTPVKGFVEVRKK